jgi:hypothetical protein
MKLESQISDGPNNCEIRELSLADCAFIKGGLGPGPGLIQFLQQNQPPNPPPLGQGMNNVLKLLEQQGIPTLNKPLPGSPP